MTPEEYAGHDALALAELVRRGEVTPSELIDAAIARIERLDGRLNAVPIRAFEAARLAANGPLPDGPFRGVPFLPKDLGLEWEGLPQYHGSRYFKGYVPKVDVELASRYRRAGLVALGRSNSPEFGLSITTEPAVHGPCRNPWNPAHSPGGSTGGGGAAVATGMVPMAHANDGGGSIRIPASACGVFGLKPTRGRTPVGPFFGEVWNGHVANHALTRSVRDSAALLDASHGPSLGDPYAAPPPNRRYIDEVGRPPGRLRIGFSVRAPLPTTGVHPDAVAAVETAAKLLSDLGHAVEPAAPVFEADWMMQAHGVVVVANLAADLRECVQFLGRPPGPDDLEPDTWTAIREGQKISAEDFELARRTIHRLSRRIAVFFQSYDAWLTPTLPEPPAKLGTMTPARIQDFIAFTSPFNATGQPAMSVPMTRNADGLPIGVQFVGRFGDEATLFRLAAQIEAARPWVAAPAN
jgi:Asp-tRNA(Asn)/Glu-tRNA(Gln) amidotransferase A subunit family amidase